jgi:L-seryl-tRNA(Ser) seleniumtransferase
MKEMLRQIPQVDVVLRHEKWKELSAYPINVAKDHLRDVLDEVRESIRAGNTSTIQSVDSIIAETMKRTARTMTPSLKKVINGTGVVIHTNLGRALLSDAALKRVVEIASGYSNLEYDVGKGERGDRYSTSSALLAQLTGMEAAIAVNNNAAAVLLVLNTFADGKEVVIGRGELVEIGGSFRIPEVMKKSGAILTEVGTTNRTYIEDYERAITENTGLIMKAHTSNYRIRGFVHEVGSDELGDLGRKWNIPFYYDLGSGLFSSLSDDFGVDEPTVAEEAKKGLDLISFSGDKLLGGPQSGIILGKKEYIRDLRKNPLTRALRPDKLSLAALEATLLDYFDREKSRRDIPVLAMLYQSEETLKKRAEKLVRALRQKKVDAIVKVASLTSEIGGGSAPDTYIPSWGLSVEPTSCSVDRASSRLRSLEIPIITRVEKGRLFLDVRTIRGSDEADLLHGLTTALSGDGR